MNKKLIRLTESDLHRIVKESVNKILSELDWKTNMSAAQKRRAQGKHDKAQALMQHGATKFNDKHFGDNQHNGIPNPNAYEEDMGTQYNSLSAKLGLDSGEMRDKRNGSWQNPGSGQIRHRFGNGYHKQQDIEKGSNLGKASDEYNEKMKHVADDLNAFYNGGAEYTKGKGWDI